jgi:hypothetical protein
MQFDPGPFVLTLIRTGSRQKAETFEVSTIGLALDGALQYVAEGRAHSIPTGGWKSFEVSRPGFRIKHVPGQAPAKHKTGSRTTN